MAKCGAHTAERVFDQPLDPMLLIKRAPSDRTKKTEDRQHASQEKNSQADTLGTFQHKRPHRIQPVSGKQWIQIQHRHDIDVFEQAKAALLRNPLEKKICSRKQ